jgi:hypothetical protein
MTRCRSVDPLTSRTGSVLDGPLRHVQLIGLATDSYTFFTDRLRV